MDLASPIPRRRFLATAALGAATGNTVGPARVRAARRPVLSFGVVADPQYVDVAPAGTRYYRQSVAKLTEAIAYFNYHAGAFAVFEGVPCLTFQGMVETERTNAYAVVRLFADRLEVVGRGREPSRELPLRSA